MAATMAANNPKIAPKSNLKKHYMCHTYFKFLNNMILPLDIYNAHAYSREIIIGKPPTLLLPRWPP